MHKHEKSFFDSSEYETRGDIAIGFRIRKAAIFKECLEQLNPHCSFLPSWDDFGILNAMPVPIAVAHCETGVLLFTNASYATMLGYTPQELMHKKTWMSVVADLSLAEVNASLKAEADFGTHPMKHARSWIKKDGTQITGSAWYFKAKTSSLRYVCDGEEKVAKPLEVVICQVYLDGHDKPQGVKRAVECTWADFTGDEPDEPINFDF